MSGPLGIEGHRFFTRFKSNVSLKPFDVMVDSKVSLSSY